MTAKLLAGRDGRGCRVAGGTESESTEDTRMVSIKLSAAWGPGTCREGPARDRESKQSAYLKSDMEVHVAIPGLGRLR